MCRLLSQKETPIEKKMQSLSLNRSEVTPPTTPTKIGSFNFTSPTKVRITIHLVLENEIIRVFVF